MKRLLILILLSTTYTLVAQNTLGTQSNSVKERNDRLSKRSIDLPSWFKSSDDYFVGVSKPNLSAEDALNDAISKALFLYAIYEDSTIVLVDEMMSSFISITTGNPVHETTINSTTVFKVPVGFEVVKQAILPSSEVVVAIKVNNTSNGILEFYKTYNYTSKNEDYESKTNIVIQLMSQYTNIAYQANWNLGSINSSYFISDDQKFNNFKYSNAGNTKISKYTSLSSRSSNPDSVNLCNFDFLYNINELKSFGIAWEYMLGDIQIISNSEINDASTFDLEPPQNFGATSLAKSKNVAIPAPIVPILLDFSIIDNELFGKYLQK